MLTRQSMFNEVLADLMNGGDRVFVLDQEGRRGEVIAMSEFDPESRTPADAVVMFERGHVVTYTAERFNRRLRLA
jgi:hypothetical protein